jgi:plasmid stability protein
MEEEMREILESTDRPQGSVKLGSLLARIGRRARLTDREFALFERVRDSSPAGTVNFK